MRLREAVELDVFILPPEMEALLNIVGEVPFDYDTEPRQKRWVFAVDMAYTYEEDARCCVIAVSGEHIIVDMPLAELLEKLSRIF